MPTLTASQMQRLTRLPEGRSVSLWDSQSESEIKVTVIEDGWNGCPWYLFGHEFGPTDLVRANSLESAWEAWLDEQPTIDVADVAEAYDGDELVEGYHYQANSTDSGIVDVGHYAWQHDLADSGYTVIVRNVPLSPV